MNFPRVSFFMLRWQALTVAAVILIVWLDFSKICLPHPSTTASLMFCRFAKFLPKGKTWGRTRQRPAMTDFHRKVNKFWQRFAKCDPCLASISASIVIAISWKRSGKFFGNKFSIPAYTAVLDSWTKRFKLTTCDWIRRILKRRNLNRKHLGGKYPDSFICVYRVQYASC